MQANTQIELIQKITIGNTSAFEEVYRLHYKALCRFAYKYIDDVDNAQDIVQDTMLKVWEQRARLSEISNIKSYLFLAVKNSCLNYLEHKKVMCKHAEIVSAEINLLSLQESNLAFEEEHDLLEEKIFEAIENLPKQCGDIFKMKYIEGKKIKEIAELSNLSPRTVEAHVFNALKKLRAACLHLMPILILWMVCFFSKIIK